MDNGRPKKDVLTAAEVSERLRISLSTVHHLSRTGKIKGVKMGKQWRYVREDVERCFVDDLTVHPAPQKRSLTEKRKSSRINCCLKARASRLLSPEKNWSGEGQILNLSAGGTLFESDHNIRKDENLLEVNDPITVKFQLESQELKLNGRIVHLEPRKDKLHVGVKFRILAPEIEKILQNFIG